ncbi:MFS transporter [Gorillibacterium sp. CAU 1737]|uniref:MFS transporter n=1 Tax=Gorillibacterium sp. CAU 1737 TaxID=3140362 RepID=UPI003260AF52
MRAERFRLRSRFAPAAVPPEKRLSQDAKLSLIIHFLFQFGASMSGVFLNLYLWRLTESLTINGIYNIINFGISPFAFAVGGWLAKKRDPLFVYRIGIAWIAIFYLVVLLVQERVVELYPWFALLGGIGGGLYWVGYLVLMYDVCTEANRIRYLAFNTIFFTAAGLAGPAIAGFVIARSGQLSGYLIVFASTFVLLLLAAVGSLKIRPILSRRKRYFLHFGPLIMLRNREWLIGLGGYLVLGLFQGSMLFLPNILLYRVLAREDFIGYLGVLFSGVSIVVAYFISRYAREERRTTYLWVAGIGLAGGAAILQIGYGVASILGFLVMNALFSPLQGNTMTSFYFGVTSRLPLKGQLRVEAVVFREAFLNLGRILSISVLIVFAADLATDKLTLILLVTACTQLVLPLMVRQVRR